MIIFHLPVCFDDIPRITGARRQFEVDCLEFNLERMQSADVEVYVSVSINGSYTSEYVEQVYSLVDKYDNVEYFHRANTGYQWGGYYDVWKRTKHFDVDKFGTMEIDHCLYKDWYKKLGRHHTGMPPWKNHMEPVQFPPDWRGNRRMEHTQGPLHICSRELLTALDKNYGCFTNSAGCDHEIDGIVHGEVTFCGKIIECGYKLNPVERICIPIIQYKRGKYE